MLLQPSHQIIPALSAFLTPSESASLPFYSILTASTSHSDHQKKSILSPVSFTPIHYGPINLPKGQSSENFQCLSPREFRPTFLAHSLQFGFHQNLPAVLIYPFIYLSHALAKLPYLLSLKQIFYSCTFVQFPFYSRKAIPHGHLTGQVFFYLPTPAQDATSLMISWLLPLGND